MYPDVTLKKYLCDFLHLRPSQVWKFDNGNGKVGYRIEIEDMILRKDIAEIEKKTDLFLQSINLNNSYELPEDAVIELEFIKI